MGAAIAGAVVAGAKAGGHDDFAKAQAAICGIKDVTYKPITKNHKVYQKLYALYKQLHDAFGVQDWSGKLANVMKELLNIKDSVQN